MAHYSLLAILHQPSATDAAEDVLVRLLAPFRDVDNGPELERECVSCLHLPRLGVRKKVREEADRRFGSCRAMADRFERMDAAPPALPTLDDEPGDAPGAWQRYERWATAWREFVGARLAWETEQTEERRAAIAPRPECKHCHGTGREMSGLVFGKWDYWTLYEDEAGGLRALWQKLGEQRPDAATRFVGGMAAAGRFHPAAISGECLRYLAAHERAVMPFAVLTADGSWHEREAAIWGVAQLPAAERHLTWYAEDEFWPLRFRALVEQQVEADDLCFKLDCHT